MHRTAAITVAALLGLAAGAAAQQPDEAERARVRDAMMAAMQPGPEHARLAALAGDWTLEVRMWPAPGAEPMVSAGTARSRMILGDRFLEIRSEGGEGAMRVESLLLLGFDRRTGEYTIVALDTWGTYYVTAAGAADAAGRIVLEGVNEDPISRARETYQMIFRPIDADAFVHEIVFTDPAHTSDGVPFRMVEVTYRRHGGSR